VTDVVRKERVARGGRWWVPASALRALLWALRGEIDRVFRPVLGALRERGGRAVPMALCSAALVTAFALLQHTEVGWSLVEHVAAVYQALPLWLIVGRLPLSMFAPAPDLPAWGAVAQVLAVFGAAEIQLGRRRTLLVAVCANALTTLSARLMWWAGSVLGVGTPQIDAYELDTGPSTVVVALSVYVLLRRRGYVLLAGTVGAMVLEALLLPNLAGREHLVAVGLGLGAFVFGDRIPVALRDRRARLSV
jgi:hypothetical protein